MVPEPDGEEDPELIAEPDVAALPPLSPADDVGRDGDLVLAEPCDTVGTDATEGFEDDSELSAWSPNAPTPTPTRKSSAGIPARIRMLLVGGCDPVAAAC